MQFVSSASCNSYSTVGSILHAGLPAVRPPIEESAIPSIFFRGCQRNAELGRTGPQADSCLAFPIFFGPRRFHASYQHARWCHHRRPYLHLWVILSVQRIGTPLEPAVPIQDPHLPTDILPNAEFPETSRRPLASQMA